MKGEGQEGQGGLFVGDAGEVAIALPPVAIEEANYSLGKHLTVIGVRDGTLSRATYTLAAAQRPRERRQKILTSTSSVRLSAAFLLLGASFIWKSKDTNRRRDEVTLPWSFINEYW